MSSPSPSPSSDSLLFHGARVVVGKEVPDRSKLARLLSENGAFCLSGSAFIADLKLPTPLSYGDVYFLLDSFTGETFEDLKRKGAKIIGPQVVYDSLRLQKPLPVASHPVFCRTLDGMHITCTGLNPRKRAEVEVLVQYMNGSYCKDLTTSIDCLIASEVGSEKYHVATQRQIPVLCYSWIVHAWKSQTQPPVKNFALPPLSGLLICVTGLIPETRVLIRKLVSQNGGRYSADLTRNCTHLLAENTSGDKVQYAAVWGIPTVTTDWLLDCVNQQAYQDVSRYLVCPNFANTAAADSDFLSACFPSSSPSLFLPTPSPFVPLSPSPSESLIVHTTPSAQRRRTAIRRHTRDSNAHIASPPVSALSPSPSASFSSSRLLNSSADFSSPVSSSSSSPSAQLQSLYRSVADICRQLRLNPQHETLPRELARLCSLIDTVTSSLLTPHTAAALLLTADSGTTPLFRDACLRYIAEHYEEVRNSASFTSLPLQLQYEIESLLGGSATTAAAVSVSAGASSAVSASTSSLPDMASGSSADRGRGAEDSTTSGGKRRRIT